jgi:hypothetical protein
LEEKVAAPAYETETMEFFVLFLIEVISFTQDQFPVALPGEHF